MIYLINPNEVKFPMKYSIISIPNISHFFILENNNILIKNRSQSNVTLIDFKVVRLKIQTTLENFEL